MRFLFLLLIIPLTGAAQQPFIRPPYLNPGDTVGIVTPAGKLRANTDTTSVRKRLEAWGLNVRFAPHYAAQEEPYFAVPDSLRATDLQQMIDDPGIKAIISYKGGYGSVRLLPQLQLQALHHHPKWIVGFSDITMLHLALGQLGIESIHGPMPTTFRFEKDSVDSSAESLRRALFGHADSIATTPHPYNTLGEACGVLAGGNLTLVCSAIGTPEQINSQQPTILLLEDVGEYVYRIDRMMQQLLRSGLLGSVKAVLVGHFTNMKDTEKFGDPQQVIAQYLKPLGIPVVFGFPSGHEDPNYALYMGREAHLKVEQTGTLLQFL